MDLPENDQALIEKEIFGTRPKARARFFLHGSKNGTESEAVGYPVFDDKIYIEIKIPDSPDFVSRLATDADFREYAQSYEHFKRFRDWKQHSLELLPEITPSTLACLKALNFHTIEQLAAHTPDNAPWLKQEENYPALKGELPPNLTDIQTTAKRFLSFWNNVKPRLRIVDGVFTEVA